MEQLQFRISYSSSFGDNLTVKRISPQWHPASYEPEDVSLAILG